VAPRALDTAGRSDDAKRSDHSQKLEALGHLAGGVAHEFNNLLTAIGGFAKMALKRLDRADYVRDCLEEIVASADQAANLTRQMLALGRKQGMDARIVRPAAIVVGLDRMLRTLVPETIALEFEIADADASVEADPSLLSQAILNLALNARDAMPAGGRLGIGTRVTAPPATAAAIAQGLGDPCAAIFVRDTGTGINSDVLKHIFEPFFTTKELDKGTGLGLAVAQGFVERSGGIIDVETEEGRGTTFTIYLPFSARAPLADKARGAGRSVLVVAREPKLRNLAYAALTEAGYRCAKAVDGAEALVLLARMSAPPDLMLAGSDDIVAGLRARYPLLDVLLVSGLAKPVTPEHLVASVRAALERG
jgi:signal transduction histidine kinase